MNNISEIKSNLHQYIADTDDIKLLNKLQEYFKKLLDKENSVIAYSSQGKPLSSKAYKTEIDQAIEAADNGDVVSQSDMEKDIMFKSL